MNEKPKISPNDTYIFDPEDIEELDELSLTGAIREAAEGKDEEESDEPKQDFDDLEFDVLSPED